MRWLCCTAGTRFDHSQGDCSTAIGKYCIECQNIIANISHVDKVDFRLIRLIKIDGFLDSTEWLGPLTASMDMAPLTRFGAFRLGLGAAIAQAATVPGELSQAEPTVIKQDSPPGRAHIDHHI